MMHVSHTAGSFQSPYSSNKFKNIQNFTGGFCVNGASSKQGGFCVCGACVRVCVCVCVCGCVCGFVLDLASPFLFRSSSLSLFGKSGVDRAVESSSV
jgi:hypothetical protein